MTTMTVVKLRPTLAEIKSLLSADKDFLKPLVRTVLQEVLEAEMTDALGAAKSERVEGRLGYRSGHYSRSLVTRIGKIERSAHCCLQAWGCTWSRGSQQGTLQCN
jgi:putative transposase